MLEVVVGDVVEGPVLDEGRLELLAEPGRCNGMLAEWRDWMRLDSSDWRGGQLLQLAIAGGWLALPHGWTRRGYGGTVASMDSGQIPRAVLAVWMSDRARDVYGEMRW